jgi:hypothetical protein
MNNFYNENKIAIYGVAFLLVLATIIVMPFITTNLKNKAYLQKEILKQAQLENCNQTAGENYHINWGSQCTDGTIDCTLPRYIADNLADIWENELDRCASIYK